MARMLRSRSMRVLRGGQKETHQQETDGATPPPSDFRVEFDRLKAATPVSRAAEERVETPNMERPKTSGGPGDRGKQFHKKVAPAAPSGTDGQAFAFPFLSPANKSTTFLYTAEIHEEQEGVIGIALGSPTMLSHSHTTNFVTSHSGTVTYISSNNPSHNYLPEPTDVKQDSPKPKMSRWKSIFKKSPLPQQQQSPFYQLAPAVSAARMDSHQDNDSMDSRTMSPLEVSPPPFRPEIRESRKVPKGQPQPPIETRPHALTIGASSSVKAKSTKLRSASSPKPPPKDYSPTVPQVIVSGSQNHSPRTIGERPLLDVDIPSIQMERYSVMFGNLLQPNSNSSRSSLLARRQGNSDRLKPLNELSKKNEDDGTRNGTLKPQRRATSPSFPKSPSVGLSLFPQPAESDRRRTPSPRAISVHRPRPLQRSKTAPSVSPSRQNFSKPRPSNDSRREASQDSERLQVVDQDSLLVPQISTPTPSTSHSFDSESEDITIVVGRAASWKPQIEENEPQWEIVTKPAHVVPAIGSIDIITNPNPIAIRMSNAASQDGPSSAPIESASRAEYKAKTQLASPTNPQSAGLVGKQSPNESSKATLGVGVARSVSVTRANRPEFLKPMLVKRATEGAERLVDTRALTPTLVELKNRKSQRVQLVEA